MKQKLILVVAILLMASIGISYATYSRVESMGKSDDFFMDDISIFTNPANISLYANFLTGELGQLNDQNSNQEDPEDQWFGGVGSYKLGSGAKALFGVAFNRKDELVTKFDSPAIRSKYYKISYADPLVIGRFLYRDTSGTSDSFYSLGSPDTITLSQFTNGISNTVITAYYSTPDTISTDSTIKTIPKPVGETEFFLGYSDGKALHIGGHFYMAKQDSGVKDDPDKRASSRVFKGDVGVNMGIGNHSLELAVGIADVSFNLMPPNSRTEWVAAFKNPESEKAIYVSSRMFLDMPALGGKIVPIIKYASSKVNVFSENVITGGLGYNRKIEKGIFYAGLSGILTNQMDSTMNREGPARNQQWYQATENQTVRINFGIERNIRWQWFTVRVGGQKELTRQIITRTDGRGAAVTNLSVPASERYWLTNADEDGTVNDLIGFGIGLNFGNKLKVDGTINEAFPFINPFSYVNYARGRRIATRVSATYSF